MNDFIPEAPEVEGATQPTPSDTPSTTPTTGNQKAWNECSTALQLFNAGYTYFVSSERQDNNGTKFKYSVEIKNIDIETEFKGNDLNGNDISRSYGGMFGASKKYKSSEGAELRFGSENNVDEKCIEFKPHNMQNYIKFYLAKKS